MGQFWMEITALSGSDFDGIQQSAVANTANKTVKRDLQAMYLRDMRKRASDLADDLDQASKLLQHSNSAITKKHYRTEIARLSPVR